MRTLKAESGLQTAEKVGSVVRSARVGGEDETVRPETAGTVGDVESAHYFPAKMDSLDSVAAVAAAADVAT